MIKTGLALVYISPAKKLKPTAADAPYFFEIANQRADFNQAREYCQLAIKLAPQSTAAQDAQLLLEVGLPDHDLSPEANALYKEGVKQAQQGRLKQARASYEKVLALEPKLFIANGGLAYIALTEKNYAQAEALLKAAIAQNPKYARGYWRLSLVYKEMGKADLAAEALAKAHELDPKDPYF